MKLNSIKILLILFCNNSRNKEKIICFIDLGQSKLSLHLCSFTNKDINILYSKSNKYIGCRDFDMKILNYLEKLYPKQIPNIKKKQKVFP